MKEERSPTNNPQSVLRSGRFASRAEAHEKKGYASGGYNLQPLLVNEEVMKANSKKVGFPSRSKEATIHCTPLQLASSPLYKPRKHKTKLTTVGYGKSGSIQSRAGVTPLLIQRWSRACWLHVYPATLKLFDSEKKMNQWKKLHNVSHEGKDRLVKNEKKLVLASINFDNAGNLQKKIESFNARKVNNDGSLPANGEKDIEKINSNNAAKNDRAFKYIMEDVRSKYYSRSGPLMHTFKISYLGTTGRTIHAAFGSFQAEELKKLRSVIRYCIRLVRKASSSKSSKPRFSDGASVFSGMTSGATSTLSRTSYGVATMTARASKRSKMRRSRLPVD